MVERVDDHAERIAALEAEVRAEALQSLADKAPVPGTDRWRLLGDYVVQRARQLGCEEFVRQHGPVAVLRDDKGGVKAMVAEPRIGIGDRAAAEARRLAGLLGMRA